MNKVGKNILVFLIFALSLFQVFLLLHKFEFFGKDTIANNQREGVKIEVTNSDDTTEEIEEDSKAYLPDRIVIEAISVDLPVVPVNLENGTWEVLSNVANYAVGTDLIREDGGNVGIYGHALNEIFLKLKNLIIGDTITLYSGDKKAVYEVYESVVVYPEQVTVFESSPDSILTLVTCDGRYSEKRYIVLAKLKIME